MVMIESQFNTQKRCLYGVLNHHDFVLEQEYRKKIDYLESAELEKDTLKDENFRLRDEMQAR